MNVILWAVVGLAVLVLLIAISVTCSAFSTTFACEAVFDKITCVLLHTLGIATVDTGFAALLILMMERGGA